jgi:hypothetical protein
MMTTLLQIICAVGAAACLFYWLNYVRRRNAASWESLLARLRPGWNARELVDLSFSNDEPNTSPQEYWGKLLTAHGLWTMYANAGVMLEMVNYAAHHGHSLDREMLARLRSDALEIRINVLKTVAEYACGAMGESVSMCALRAESAYSDMTAGMLALLEKNAGGAVPAFVAAM